MSDPITIEAGVPNPESPDKIEFDGTVTISRGVIKNAIRIQVDKRRHPNVYLSHDQAMDVVRAIMKTMRDQGYGHD